MIDPTKAEMLAALETAFKGCEFDEFDTEGAIYWFAADYHGGQWSNLYSALSTSPYRPGACESGPEDGSTAADMFEHLVREFGE